MQGSFVILVCSAASTLLVYKDGFLQWNCKLPFAPLVIQIAKFQVTWIEYCPNFKAAWITLLVWLIQL